MLMEKFAARDFLSSFTGTYEIVSGTGDYDGASGEGESKLLIGKKRFGGKISGDILIPPKEKSGIFILIL